MPYRALDPIDSIIMLDELNRPLNGPLDDDQRDKVA